MQLHRGKYASPMKSILIKESDILPRKRLWHSNHSAQDPLILKMPKQNFSMDWLNHKGSFLKKVLCNGYNTRIFSEHIDKCVTQLSIWKISYKVIFTLKKFNPVWPCWERSGKLHTNGLTLWLQAYWSWAPGHFLTK